MTDHRTAAPAWPRRLSRDELRELTGVFGVVGDPVGPLDHWMGDHAARSASGAGEDGPGLEAALWTLAAPQQILVIRRPYDEVDPVALLLSDGVRIVRFALDDASVVLSAALRAETLLDVLRAWLPPAGEAADVPDELVADRLLTAVAVLQDAGLSRAAGLRRSDAASAIVPALDAGVDPDLALRALADEGVIVLEHDGVRWDPRWRTRFAYLLEDPALTVEVFDLDDARHGRQRPATLLALGRHGERLTVLPAQARTVPGVAVRLVAPTEAALTEAVDVVTAPPPMPPRLPVVASDGTAPIASDHDAWPPPPVRDFAELDLGALPGELDAAIGAALTPSATIEVMRVRAGEARGTLRVIALGSEGAVEWEPQGSVVRWRPLEGAQLAGRLADLLPPVDAVDAVGAAEPLSVTAVAHLIAGRPPAEAVPPGLLSAARDADRCWSTLRAWSRHGALLSGVALVTVFSPRCGTWRLDPTSDGFEVAPSDGAALLAELLQGLRAPEA